MSVVASIDKIYQRSRSLKVTPFTLGKPDFIVIRGKGLNSTNKRSNYGNQLNLRITFRFLKQGQVIAYTQNELFYIKQNEVGATVTILLSEVGN